MRRDPTKILEDLRATFWFIPSCMVVAAVALSVVMPLLDARFAFDPPGAFGWIGETDADDLRPVLILVAGSIIGVASTTFSITMVAVSSASANFGPRLIGNFMRDRGNQLTLGTFIATFVYCLLVLPSLHDGADAHLSVSVALVLAIASVGVFIFFIHHVPETLNIDGIVADIGCRLRHDVTALFPAQSDIDVDVTSADLSTLKERIERRDGVPVRAIRAGYLQSINMEQLVELADEHGLLVRVQYRPGDFVTVGDALLEHWPDEDGDGSAAVTVDMDALPIEGLLDCFELGFQRDPHQDCLFLVNQLAEVIARALSPGTNDPFTAITCLEWLKGALMAYLDCTRERPPLNAVGPVLVHPIDFEQIIATAFDGTRQYICADRIVSLHAMTVLAEVGAKAAEAEHLTAVRRRMDELLAASVATLAAHVGGSEVEARHAEVVRLLDDAALQDRRRVGTGWFGGSG